MAFLFFSVEDKGGGGGVNRRDKGIIGEMNLWDYKRSAKLQIKDLEVSSIHVILTTFSLLNNLIPDPTPSNSITVESASIYTIFVDSPPSSAFFPFFHMQKKKRKEKKEKKRSSAE